MMSLAISWLSLNIVFLGLVLLVAKGREEQKPSILSWDELNQNVERKQLAQLERIRIRKC